LRPLLKEGHRQGLIPNAPGCLHNRSGKRADFYTGRNGRAEKAEGDLSRGKFGTDRDGACGVAMNKFSGMDTEVLEGEAGMLTGVE
jgi:hypothetical protein